jgi:hypothetical protein
LDGRLRLTMTAPGLLMTRAGAYIDPRGTRVGAKLI